MIKQIAKTALRRLGVDVVRWKPPESSNHGISYPGTEFLSDFRIRTVLDIGASEGDFAQTMLGRLGDATVYSFEPLAEPYAILHSRLKDEPRSRHFNCAIGDANTELEIHRSVYSPSSSILPMAKLHGEAFPHTEESGGIEKVRVQRLDDVVKDLALEDDLFVKIDVQGFEANVIRGGAETLRRAQVMVIETSFQTLYEGQPLFDDIYRLLKELGFAYEGNWDQLRHPQRGCVLQADAIFVRKAAPGPRTV